MCHHSVLYEGTRVKKIYGEHFCLFVRFCVPLSVLKSIPPPACVSSICWCVGGLPSKIHGRTMRQIYVSFLHGPQKKKRYELVLAASPTWVARSTIGTKFQRNALKSRHVNIEGTRGAQPGIRAPTPETPWTIVKPTIMVKGVWTVPICPLPRINVEYQLHTVRNGHQLTPTLIRGGGGEGEGGGGGGGGRSGGGHHSYPQC